MTAARARLRGSDASCMVMRAGRASGVWIDWTVLNFEQFEAAPSWRALL